MCATMFFKLPYHIDTLQDRWNRGAGGLWGVTIPEPDLTLMNKESRSKKIQSVIKVEFAGVSIFSRTNFLPWEFLLIKKLEFDNTNPIFSKKSIIFFDLQLFYKQKFPRKEICLQKKVTSSPNSALVDPLGHPNFLGGGVKN